jgi:hypothetical protein
MTADIKPEAPARTDLSPAERVHPPTSSTASEWTLVRTSIEAAATRLAALLRTVADGSVRAVGTWSIAETAAHTLVACQFDAFAAGAREPPPRLLDLGEMLLSAGVGDVAFLNQQALERETERNLAVLAGRIEDEVASLMAATSEADEEATVAWLGGASLSRTAVLAHLLFELLIHGRDIARSQGRPWPFPDDQAGLILERFFREYGVERFVVAPVPPAGDVSCVIRVDGRTPLRLSCVAGRVRLDEASDAVADVWVRADASVLLLIMFGRVSPLAAVLRGKVRVWGRRPWRLRRLTRILRMP